MYQHLICSIVAFLALGYMFNDNACNACVRDQQIASTL